MCKILFSSKFFIVMQTLQTSEFFKSLARAAKFRQCAVHSLNKLFPQMNGLKE